MADNSSAWAEVKMVIDRLLDPQSGCPWDLKQTPETIVRYLLEETYELIEAMKHGVSQEIQEEMGDCFFLLAFLSKLFDRLGFFDLEAVLLSSARKMMARHPHIFSDSRKLDDAEQVVAQWHELKKKEKPDSILAGVPAALPALMRAHRLSQRAGQVGFDWSGPSEILLTLSQEMEELKQAIEMVDEKKMAAELGDVLFTVANLARHLKVSAEEALQSANDRFAARFQYIEKSLREQGRTLDQATLAELDKLWAEAKESGL